MFKEEADSISAGRCSHILSTCGRIGAILGSRLMVSLW